jgi:hypothetical protein
MRRGSLRDEGDAGVEFRNPQWSWDRETKRITMQAEWVLDFRGSARHDYTITLSMADLRAILHSANVAVTGPGSEVGAELGASVRDLVNLLAASFGV